ncbi:MAG: hypothetical protein R3292_12480 [Alcanivorax sp.]|nr:hypothetical protein [Alcanivorax sp.]
MILLATLLAGQAFAAAPAMITLAQLARQEGWNPDAGDPANMARGIPRDFPVPTFSHHLTASNMATAAGVEGVNAEQAASFYRQVFALENWHIDKQVTLPGYINLIACKKTQCVNLDAASPGGIAGNPNKLNLLFYKATGKP